jgi:Na+/melibiose symporter-like transporter
MPAQTKEMWPGIKLITLSNVGIRLTKARKTPSDKVSIIMKSISNTDNSIVYSFPGKVRFFYGFGSIADGGINIIFGVYLLFYFTQVRGLSGTLAGLAIFIALLVDAITDPIMGSISDNCQSRWGRRHPFIYASILPFGACFYLLFNSPQGLSQNQLFVWMVAFMVGVRVSYTFYAIPSSALAAELTDDFDERTRIVSWRILFGWFGSVVLTQIALRYYLVPSVEFSDGRFNESAYGELALVSALAMMLAVFVCAAGTHSQIPRLKQAPAKTRFSLKRVISELKGPFSNRSFIALVFAALFTSAGVGYSTALTFYLETYFWELSTLELAQFVYPVGLATLLGFTATSPLVERFDKKQLAIVTAVIYLIVAPLPLYLRMLGLMPENGDPWLLPILMCAVFVSCLLVVSNSIIFGSMFVDVIDENELFTGLRQEGVFNSALAFVFKSVSGVGGFMAGFVLDLVAFPKDLAPGEVPPETLVKLALSVGLGATVLTILSVIFLTKYTITRVRYHEILAVLAERRFSVSNAKGCF